MARYEVLNTRIELGDTMLTNVRTGAAQPSEGEPWTYYLFLRTIERRRTPKREYDSFPIRSVRELSAATREEADELLLAFVEQQPNIIIQENA